MTPMMDLVRDVHETPHRKERERDVCGHECIRSVGLHSAQPHHGEGGQRSTNAMTNGLSERLYDPIFLVFCL